MPPPTQLSTSNFPQSKPHHSSLDQVSKDTGGRPGSPSMMMTSEYLSGFEKEASSTQQKGKFSTEYVDNQTEFNHNETNTTPNLGASGESLDLTPTNGEFGTLTSADSAFSEMFTEEQDGSKMSKPHVSNSTSFSFENFGDIKGTLRTFAEDLKFVDSSNDSQYGSSERSVSKAQVVYRPIEISNTADITMIPSSGFFDPSQSQAEFNNVDIGFLPAVPESEVITVGDSSVKANKSKEKSKENRKSPSRFRLLNRNSKSKIIEEEPESEDAVGDDEDTPKIKAKFPKKGKESKSSSPKTPSANVSSEPTSKKNSRDSSPSVTSKPPLPSLATPKKTRPKKNSYSFRQAEKPKSPDFKSSMPNLASPTHSRNSSVSPESFISSGSDDNFSGKKPSLRKRISQSLRDLVGKESPSSSSKSSWKFSEDVKPTNTNSSVLLLEYRPLDETMAKLPSSVSETHVTSLSNFDRHSMHEDTEFIPGSINKPIFEERAVDVEIIPRGTNSVSSDEYHTASESEQESGSAGLAMTSIQILNSPTGLSQDFGYAPRKKTVDTPPITSSSLAQESKGSTKGSKSTISLKQGAVVSGKGVRKASTPQKNSSPKSSQRIASKSLVSGVVKKVGSPQISPRSSQRTTVAQSAKKATSITVTVIGKSSPSSSPRSSLNVGKVGASQLTKKPTPTSSPRSSLRMTTSKTAATSITKSPLLSQRATTSQVGTKSSVSLQSSQRVSSSSVPQSISPRSSQQPTTSGSPQSSRKFISRVVPGKTGSPSASPRSSLRGTSVTTSGSNIKSSTPGKTGSPTSSPRSSQRLGKVGTTSSASKSSPKSSPSLARKVQPPTTSTKKNSSPSIESPLLKRKQSSPLNKPSAPKLSKTSMEPLKEGGNNSDSFSRFTRGRTPIKIKGTDTTVERAKRLKEHRKSESFGLKPANSSKPDSARRATIIVARKPLPLVITAGDPSQISPDVTTPTTPGGTKKRKMGLTVAPILEELITETTATPSKSTEQMNELVTKSAADISRDVDSLLSAVGQTLDVMALSESTSSVDPQPPSLASMEVKVFEATPLHSRESSIDIDTFLEQAAEQEAAKEKEKQKKKVLKDKSPNISRTITNIPSPKNSKLMSKTKSEPHIIGGAFTASLPPRPPLSKQASESSTADRKTSKTGTNRPRQVIVAGTLSAATTPPLRSSARKSEPSKTTTASSAGSNKTMPLLKPQSKSTNTLGRFTSTGTTSSSGISSRSSMRASTRTKKISLTTPPLHGVKSSGTKSKDSTLSRIGDRSMKSRVSTTSRPGSSVAVTKKSSVGSGLSQDSASTRKVSTLSAPSRGRSMRRVSSGDILQRKVKPGTSATLSRSSNSGVYSSMRKSGKFNTIRPRSSSNAGIVSQSTNTMRRTPSGSRKVSAPSSTLTRQSVSASAVGSQSRKGTLRRTGSGGEGFAAFDHISSQAQGSM